jgi:hypothetical protein
MATAPLQADDVRARLRYAEKRVDELLRLNYGDLPGADAHERQQLIQEVFFHLVGAIEVFAQLVNEARSLGQSSESVGISKLIRKQWLGPADPLTPYVAALYADTRQAAPASDPYSGDGLMYRIWNYRHQVTHRRANPLAFKIELTATVRIGSTAPRRRWIGAWWTTHPLGGLMRSVPPPPERSGHLVLDPRDPARVPSTEYLQTEIHNMFTLVQDRLEAAIAAL